MYSCVSGQAESSSEQEVRHEDPGHQAIHAGHGRKRDNYRCAEPDNLYSTENSVFHRLRRSCLKKRSLVSPLLREILFMFLCLCLKMTSAQLPTQPPSQAAPSTPLPTLPPTASPSLRPTTAQPTAPPSQPPTTNSPTLFPTVSSAPSVSPSNRPTIAPSVSTEPSALPSSIPSDYPSGQPSTAPSSRPTFTETSTSRQGYRQEFLVPSDRNPPLEVSEAEAIVARFETYTLPFFSPPDGRVEVECVLDEGSLDLLPSGNVTAVSMDYACSWSSNTTIVETYPDLFQVDMNANLDFVLDDLNSLGDDVLRELVGVGGVRPLLPQTDPPTISPAPTAAPSGRPSSSLRPSRAPSESPSQFPSHAPSSIPSDAPSIVPTAVASALPSSRPSPLLSFPPSRADSEAPTVSEEESSGGGGGLGTGAIAGLTAGIALCLCLFVLLYKRREKAFLEAGYESDDPLPPPIHPYDDETDAGIALISPVDSLVSGKSLLSVPDSGVGDSGDEADNTKNLQDEFDQYKDQNLEKLRMGVENSVANVEGLMSAAVTTALMGGSAEPVDMEEITWGCRGNPSGAEIEASALCEVNEWLKRNERSPMDRKRAFMQDMLNKMVTCVHGGIMPPSDASRTIHESAALLGLALAHELPVTTVIVSGMRKTVMASHLTKALREFGEIDEVAVASKQRGFGIVRFRQPKAVDRAMRKFRSNEIVVQDVAVQMKVLTTRGTVEGK